MTFLCVCVSLNAAQNLVPQRFSYSPRESQNSASRSCDKVGRLYLDAAGGYTLESFVDAL